MPYDCLGSRLCKSKSHLAVNQICKIQISKARRFQSRLAFFLAPTRFVAIRPQVASKTVNGREVGDDEQTGIMFTWMTVH